MSRKILIGHFIVIFLFIISTKSNACPVSPIIELGYPSYYAPVGETVRVYAYVVNAEDVGDITWTWYGSGLSFGSKDTSHDDYSWADVKSNNPGRYTLYVIADDGINDPVYDHASFTAYEIKIEIEDCTSDHGFINVNDDDDNEDGYPDGDEYSPWGPIANEDDLVEIHLSTNPALSGYVSIRIPYPYGNNTRIWSDTDCEQGDLVIPNGPEYDNYYKQWYASRFPSTLYVESWYVSVVDPQPIVFSFWPYYSSGGLGDDKTVYFHSMRMRPYIDSSRSTLLEDWPETATEPRSPMYIFSENDPIYIEIDCYGTNPSVAETFTDIIKVESESGGTAEITLKETSPGSNVFTNIAALGELLYLSTADYAGGVDKIKVIDEEVLTFSIEIQPDSGDYRTCYKVMVDRCEVGIEWQSNYGTYDVYPQLNYADDCAQGFYNNLGTTNQIWFKNFDNGDLDSKEDNWDSGGDSQYANSVDFAFWCGHGTAETETPRALRFFVDLVGGLKQPPDKLIWSEIDWGNTDLDWVTLNTCRFLKGTDNELKAMASGVHLICGYETDMTIYNVSGQYFADQLDNSGTTIVQAWHNQCSHYQPSGNTSRVFGATTCMNEALGSTGPIQISQDPSSSSTYTHDDYTSP